MVPGADPKAATPKLTPALCNAEVECDILERRHSWLGRCPVEDTYDDWGGTRLVLKMERREDGLIC
jgi:hypothetical protein